MKKVSLNLDNRSYDILIGAGLLGQMGEILDGLGFRDKLVIITDSRVKELYGNDLEKSLSGGGYEVKLLEVEQGEENKSLETAGRLYSELTDFYAERQTPILALGGGVVGDVAGFVAATYMRGVPLVQLPTTLLAQGDSSIGGKVAVNHGQLKNKIGAFYHPKLTVSDLDTLKSLSARELSNGMAEIIKHGLILDDEFFGYIEENLEGIKALDNEVMEHVVSSSAGIKAGIVEKDELDLGLRNVLNCGHTIGHAIESVSGLQVWHGEAVAAGLLIEASISCKLGVMGEGELNRLYQVIEDVGLNTRMPVPDIDVLLEAMKHDKKIVGGKVKFVLPKGIGDVMITDDVSETLVKQVLGEWNG
jgi:3-dehydroquinate synthase